MISKEVEPTDQQKVVAEQKEPFDFYQAQKHPNKLMLIVCVELNVMANLIGAFLDIFGATDKQTHSRWHCSIPAVHARAG